MKLIAESGSTRTEWALVEDNRLIQRAFTEGLNPFFQTRREISRSVRLGLPEHFFKRKLEQVYYYGAGCTSYEKKNVLGASLVAQFKTPIQLESDLLAAARGLFKCEAGIACILGTGSNSCLYDGKGIVKSISPLGFVLGDEGSGAVLGKLLVGDVLKNQLPAALQEAFWAESGLTPAIIMDKVYKGPFPNRFLASRSPFLLRHMEEPAIRDLVSNSFRAFFARNVMQYDYWEHPVYLTGSIAWYYQDILKDVAREFELRLGTIVQSPVQGLIHYHCVL